MAVLEGDGLREDCQQGRQHSLLLALLKAVRHAPAFLEHLCKAGRLLAVLCNDLAVALVNTVCYFQLGLQGLYDFLDHG
jgi:hypothetical protein